MKNPCKVESPILQGVLTFVLYQLVYSCTSSCVTRNSSEESSNLWALKQKGWNSGGQRIKPSLLQHDSSPDWGPKYTLFPLVSTCYLLSYKLLPYKHIGTNNAIHTVFHLALALRIQTFRGWLKFNYLIFVAKEEETKRKLIIIFSICLAFPEFA